MSKYQTSSLYDLYNPRNIQPTVTSQMLSYSFSQKYRKIITFPIESITYLYLSPYFTLNRKLLTLHFLKITDSMIYITVAKHTTFLFLFFPSVTNSNVPVVLLVPSTWCRTRTVDFINKYHKMSEINWLRQVASFVFIESLSREAFILYIL